MALITYAGAKYVHRKLTQQVKNHADVPAEIEGISYVDAMAFCMRVALLQGLQHPQLNLCRVSARTAGCKRVQR